MMEKMYMRPDRGLVPWTLALAVSVAVGGCGSPTSPTPPPPQLTLACPAPQTAVSFQDQPATVTWAAPTATGGTPPIQTACTPASGSAFPVGTTAVGCTATGAGAGQTASCSFTVTVARPPQLSVSRFMAFGDSITWGTASPPAGYQRYPDPPPSYSYPSQLFGLLGVRYSDQSVTMANEGWPSEWINTGLGRLPDAMAFNTPEVVLLLEGANDLLNSPSSATTQYIAGKLRDMVRSAKTRVPSNRVLLALFPPQYHGTVPYDRGKGAEYVAELNQRITAVAQGEGATLVDLYTPMSADVKRYIGADGLHPTEQGFTLMAQTFATIIQEKFEAKSGAR
jgi:lysophospholipase L1-like esterase